MSSGVLIRPMRESDIKEAERIIKLAFGTFLGMPDPMKFMGDANYARTRYLADPPAALTAEINGKIIGSNFALDWGSVGIFGPLTVHPDYWDKGVARLLLDRTMKIFEGWCTRHLGLFTFAQSAKHVHLYQKYGFWPRYLTAVMSKDVGKKDADVEMVSYSELDPDGQSEMLQECAGLTGSILEGLDLRKEINSIQNQKLGETILLKANSELAAMATCHSGPETEAGSGTCYVKFGAARSESAFEDLLDACEQYARSQKATRIVAGANTGRHNAYRKMIERGFRADMQGIAMHRPNEQGYNREEVYLIDDWR